MNFISQESGLAFSNSHSARVRSEQLKQPSHKKRKLVSEKPAEQQNAVEVNLLNNKRRTPVSVQIAALQALEALLTVVCVIYFFLCGIYLTVSAFFLQTLHLPARG